MNNRGLYLFSDRRQTIGYSVTKKGPAVFARFFLKLIFCLKNNRVILDKPLELRYHGKQGFQQPSHLVYLKGSQVQLVYLVVNCFLKHPSHQILFHRYVNPVVLLTSFKIAEAKGLSFEV